MIRLKEVDCSCAGSDGGA